MFRVRVLGLLLAIACGGGSQSSPPPSTPAPATEEDAPEVASAPAAAEEPEAVGPSAELAAACASFAEHAAGVLAEAQAGLDALDEDQRAPFAAQSEVFRRCHDAGRGAWVLFPEQAVYDPAGLAIPYEIRFVDEAGEVHPVPAAPGLFRLGASWSDEQVAPKVLSVRDLDGDGRGELAWQSSISYPDGGEVEYALWRFREGAVQAYPLTFMDGPVDLHALVDADGDGVFEVVSASTYWPCEVTNDMDGTTHATGCPPVAFEHVGDGTLRPSGPAAERYLRGRCERTPMRLFDTDEDSGCDVTYSQVDVACERVRGRSADEVIERLRREAQGTRCGAEALQTLIDWARRDPPMVLRE